MRQVIVNKTVKFKLMLFSDRMLTSWLYMEFEVAQQCYYTWIKRSLHIGLSHRRTTLLCLSCPVSKYKLYIHRRVLINFCLTGLNNHVQFYYFNLRVGGVSEIRIFKIAGPCLDGQEQTASFCYNLLFNRIKYVFLPW